MRTSLLDLAVPAPGLGGGTSRASQLLWHYRPESDADLRAISGQALWTPASLRSGLGWASCSNGGFVRAPSAIPRFEWFDLDGDGLAETPALCCDDAETNLVGWSDVLSSWSVIGGTGSVAAGPMLGDLATFLVSDTDAVTSYVIGNNAQAISGATSKGVLIVTAKGPSAPAGGSGIRVRDTTASADRLLGGWNYDANGIISVSTPSVGTYLWSRLLAIVNGVKWYAVAFKTTACTVGNTHNVRLSAAQVTTEQGNTYFGGGFLCDDPIPGSWIETPSNASVTRAKEQIGWLAPYPLLGAQTVLLDLIEIGGAQLPGSVVWAITDKNGANPSFAIVADATGVYKVVHHNGNASVSALAPAAPTPGRPLRLVATLWPDGSVSLAQGIDGAEPTSGAPSSAQAFATTWGADAASVGYWLQPTTGLTKARTRLLEGRLTAGVLGAFDLAQRW